MALTRRSSDPCFHTPRRRSGSRLTRPGGDGARERSKERQQTGLDRQPRHTARKLSDEDARRLSFVDVTISQIRAAIAAADPSWNFNTAFWRTILAAEPSESFKPLMNRTLAYWLDVFNKWQEIRRAHRSTEIGFQLNGKQVQRVLFLSQGNLKMVLQLFDPDGARRLKVEGFTDSVMEKVKVPMLELIAAGILSTRLITTKHKLRFLFCLVDGNDDGYLCEEQLGFFIKAFVRGVGMMFNVPNDILPRHADSHRVAQRLYERIHLVAAAVGRGAEADKAPGGARDGMSADMLQEWVYGRLSEEDALALPYRLALARFCPARHADITDEFDDTLNEFVLNHTESTVIPEVVKTPAGSRVLSRAEIILARDLYNYAMDSGIMRVGDRTFDKFIKTRGNKIHPAKRDWYLEALSNLAEDMQYGKDGQVFKPDIFAYFRKLQPKALPKHLRMYDVWCMEYDQMQKEEEEMLHTDTAADQFLANSSKPLLPPDELQILRDQFKELDLLNDGVLDVSELQSGWGWSDEQALNVFKSFDVGCDGLLDEDEFLRMMCPPEYRLPEMAGFAREMFGKLILQTQKTRRGLLCDKTSKFESGNGEGVAEAPISVYPPVPDDLMEQWNDIFDGLDHDDDDSVGVRDLESSGLLSTAVSYFIAGLIDPSNPVGFNRDAFLTAMCKSHGYSRPLKL